MSFQEGEPLIHEKKVDPSEIFAEMATRISGQVKAEFGGAYVIVPPAGYEPMWNLSLDSKQDVGQFWASLKTRCEIALAELAQAEQRAQTGVWR